MKTKLREKTEALGLSVTDGQLEQFEAFYHFLIEENQKYNLTNITEENDFINKHIIDSLAGAALLENGDTVADVGSGAGFPAIPLAVVRRDCQFTLIDSLNKRVNFLNAAIERLGLENARAIHSRAEDAGRLSHREGYNTAVARAVAPLNTLCEYCLPLVRVDGTFLAYKTHDPAEIENAQNAIRVLGGKLREIKIFKLPDTDINRAIIVIDKIAKTPPQYPRGKNKEKTNPI